MPILVQYLMPAPTLMMMWSILYRGDVLAAAWPRLVTMSLAAITLCRFPRTITSFV
jgi:hypothetical protein